MVQESNLDHINGRCVLSVLCQPCENERQSWLKVSVLEGLGGFYKCELQNRTRTLLKKKIEIWQEVK